LYFLEEYTRLEALEKVLNAINFLRFYRLFSVSAVLLEKISVKKLVGISVAEPEPHQFGGAGTALWLCSGSDGIGLDLDPEADVQHKGI
jgi:hypothetical protein